MVTSTFKQFLLDEEPLHEAFDAPYPVELKPNHSKKNRRYIADATLKDGTTLSISIHEEEGNGDFYLEFKRGGSKTVTGEGDAMRIFATVLEALRQFLKMTKKRNHTVSQSLSRQNL